MPHLGSLHPPCENKAYNGVNGPTELRLNRLTGSKVPKRRHTSNVVACAYLYRCPRRKANIQGGHSISHSKQKGVYVHVSYCELCLETALWLYSSRAVDKIEVLHTVSNGGVCCSSDKVG